MHEGYTECYYTPEGYIEEADAGGGYYEDGYVYTS